MCIFAGKSVTNRSRHTYNKQGGQIKTITFCDSAQSIASASDSGAIHVFRYVSVLLDVKVKLLNCCKFVDLLNINKLLFKRESKIQHDSLIYTLSDINKCCICFQSGGGWPQNQYTTH